jgi:hypothetical protein
MQRCMVLVYINVICSRLFGLVGSLVVLPVCVFFFLKTESMCLIANVKILHCDADVK